MALLFVLIAFAHLALIVVTWRVGRRAAPTAVWLLTAVLLAIAYDNLVIAAGAIGEGSLLERISVGRVFLHVLAVPLLIPVGALLSARAGVGWCRRAAVRTGAFALAGVLILFGVLDDLLGLELVPVTEWGLVRYVAAEGGPPVGAILAILLLLVVGASTWQVARWPWLFAGAVAMFVAAGAMAAAGWIGNVGELALMLGLVGTLRRTTDAVDGAGGDAEVSGSTRRAVSS
jgi:hypothetical protein